MPSQHRTPYSQQIGSPAVFFPPIQENGGFDVVISKFRCFVNGLLAFISLMLT
jgi:hypothetical protein